MTSPQFDKYKRKGAYHWLDYYGGLLRMNSYTRARYDLVLELARKANLGPPSRILEIGCGDGALLGLLHRRLGLAVDGVDTNEQGLDFAREMFVKHKLNGNFKYVESYDTGYGSDCFDLVVCSDVIEHVEDPQTMLQEIHRVLKPGGRLIISTPIRFSELPIDPMHVQEWFCSEFSYMCGKVFGAPDAVVNSHPIIWYELISASNKWINRCARITFNLLTKCGLNPFKEHNGKWRCYTTQLLYFKK